VQVNSHTLAGWSELKNTHFLYFGQVFNLQSTRFLQSLQVFLITFIAVITYVNISTYKYPSKIPHFLTPSHILSSSFSPPIFFLVFIFLHFGVKRSRSWGSKRPIDYGHNVVNPFGLLESQGWSLCPSIVPSLFLPLLGIKW